jgi:outer membrane lipoprotein SlyB
MQQEGDRGLMGAIGGGVAGHFLGNKFGGHNKIGAMLGAFVGHKMEDKHKYGKHGKRELGDEGHGQGSGGYH